MFSVKGWTTAIENPKLDTDAKGGGAPQQRKRKRPGQRSQPPVTTANVADMWERVMEKKGRVRSKKKAGEKAELDSSAAAKEDGEQAPNAEPAAEAVTDKPEQQSSERKKDKKKAHTPKGDFPFTAAAVEETPAANDDEDEDEEWGGIEDEEEGGATIEPAQPTRQEKKEERKRKKQKTSDASPATGEKSTNAPTSKPDDSKTTNGEQHKKESKQAKKEKKKPVVAPTPAPVAAPAPIAEPKLTSLQASMRQKLVSARFRHLNETLYTRPSVDAFSLFQESPEMFSEYHEGFRRQVEVWPENPVEGYIRDIKARAKISRSASFANRNAKNDFSNPVANVKLLPLPRTGGKCTIADLGCGDAALAKALDPVKDKLHLDIRSFDLQTGGSALVTRADIANLPLADRSVDIAIFCLALMGTNWIDFVEEAYRILRWKGELWVAEIKSRFAAPNSKKRGGVVSHSVGNRKKTPAAPAPLLTFSAPGANKKPKSREAEVAEAAAQAELEVVVDGADRQKQETDIAAFVEALRRRGFALHKELGEGAADLSNKMFVKMLFVKATLATKGKHAVEEKDNKNMGLLMPTKPKFIDEADRDGNEAAILKPCVYKLR
ncbi:methyltransferase-domain-containing protein [Podospora didyma]|uniref:Ribosomal RNA-processing protein 8 n=1 Tax=Podospora didyma TaxID=330526 RepID=A0AAE0NZA0_9PEZI|nr:methyltransferase-domain-containing protein [Podospora didyma]